MAAGFTVQNCLNLQKREENTPVLQIPPEIYRYTKMDQILVKRRINSPLVWNVKYQYRYRFPVVPVRYVPVPGSTRKVPVPVFKIVVCFNDDVIIIRILKTRKKFV